MANPWNPFEQAISSSKNIKKASEAVGPVRKPLEAANTMYDLASGHTWQEFKDNQSSAVAEAEEQMNNISRTPSWSLRSLSKSSNPDKDEMVDNLQTIGESDRPGWMAIPEVVDNVSDNIEGMINRSNLSGEVHSADEPIAKNAVPYSDSELDFSQLGFFDPNNLANNLFDNGGKIDPNQAPIIGQTDKDKALKSEKEQYRKDNPMPEGAIKNGVTSQEWIDRYYDYYGDLDDSYKSAIDYITSPVTEELQTQGKMRNADTLLRKLADESIDDGTNTLENRKALYITVPEMIRQRKAGVPGRPIEELESMDQGAVINKLEEMNDYNYVPFIVDEAQRDLWNAQQVGNEGSKFFKRLATTREDWTDPIIDYNGQDLSYDQFYENASPYWMKAYKDAEDGNTRIKWTIDLGNGEFDEVYSTSQPSIDWLTDEDGYAVLDDNGNYMLYMQWPDTGEAYYLTEEDLDEDGNIIGVSSEYDIDPLTYTQYDGTEISIPYDDVDRLLNNSETNEFNVDYGPLNIAKPAAELSDLTEWNFADWIPSMIDITAGSAPLFMPQTAWPMAISNAISATQGLDANSWDSDTGTWRRISDAVDPDKYGLNVLLSGLVPLTEKFAGNLGAGRGLLGKPIDAAFRKFDINPTLKYPVDWILGEGSEEGIAGAWEELQQTGFDEAFGNDLYETDENGNVVLDKDGNPKILYDESGHQVKDVNTPLWDRIKNYISGVPENFVAGAALGTGLGLPGLGLDVKNNRGAIQEAKNRRAEIEAERALNLPRFRSVKRGNKDYSINPEILEEYRR